MDKPKPREQRRLMSDAYHSGDDGSDHDTVHRHYHDKPGCCHRIMHSKSAKLGIMLLLIVAYFFTELIVGHYTKSLTLVADSFHMLSDAISLIVALVAVKMSKRTATDPFRPWPSKEPYFNTFGWVRFEVLGALINSTFLLALCISIVLEAIEKFMSPELVDNPKLVLAVGGGGLVLNIFGLVIFGSHAHGHHHHDHGHSHKSTGTDKDSDPENLPQKKGSEEHMNMRAVFLHVLGDALGSVIVMISATVLWLVPANEPGNEWTQYLDPAMSVILVCIMVCTTVPLFKQSSMILLQTVPKHIKLEAIKRKLQKIPGIQAIHDLHIWQLTGDRIVASVHVQCANAEKYITIVQSIKVSLHDAGIHSCTVQPEFSFSEDDQTPYCQIMCGDSCAEMTCCPTDTANKTKPGEDPTSALVVELTEVTTVDDSTTETATHEPRNDSAAPLEPLTETEIIHSTDLSEKGVSSNGDVVA